jgi:hypothetical protein
MSTSRSLSPRPVTGFALTKEPGEAVSRMTRAPVPLTRPTAGSAAAWEAADARIAAVSAIQLSERLSETIR